MLKGPEAEDHTLYSSHTVWASKVDFEAWTKSDAFRTAHARADNQTTGPLYLEHPKFEGFEVRQTLKPGATFVAKMFQGSGSDQFLKELRTHFDKVSIRKPAASRKESREVYLVAKGFKGR